MADKRKPVLAEYKLEATLGYSKCRAAIIALKPGGRGAIEVAGLQEKEDIDAMGGKPHLSWKVVLEMLNSNAGESIKPTYKRPGVEGIRETEIQVPVLITEWDAGLEAEDTASRSEKK